MGNGKKQNGGSVRRKEREIEAISSVVKSSCRQEATTKHELTTILHPLDIRFRSMSTLYTDIRKKIVYHNGEAFIVSKFTHFNEQGRAKMVDVSHKPETVRTAAACSSIQVNEEIYEAIQNNRIQKGDVLAVAQVAGIMAAKKTWDIIPMCHPIPIKGIDISFSWETYNEKFTLKILAKVKTVGNTGVEMEALTAASVAALTVYDMCKAVDKGMVIGPTYLLEKTGGVSSPDYNRDHHS